MANRKLQQYIVQTLGLFLSLLPVLANAAKVTSAHVTNFASYNRVVFNISNPDKYHVFTLANPARMVVDLNDAQLKTDLAYLGQADTNISKVRTGHPVPKTLRIVFEVKSPVTIKTSVVQDTDMQTAQLIVDMYPKNGIAKNNVIHQAEVSNYIEPEPVKPIKRVAVVTLPEPQPIAAEVTPKPQIALARKRVLVPIQTLQKNARPAEISHIHTIVVVIDPGHGGKDPGTIGPRGTKEKNVVLAIATRLAELINSEPNMHAVLTRHGDYFLTLNGRLNESRKDKADIFIAIHADSYYDNQFTGAAVYALSHHGASSMTARWLADKENHSELGNVDFNELGDKSRVLRSVLLDLAQTATINDSVKLGTDMLGGLENVTTLHYPHVEQAPFMVLKSPDIPSILVETGFLSNPKEEDRLRDAAYRDKLAHAMLEGVHKYVATHPMLAKL